MDAVVRVSLIGGYTTWINRTGWPCNANEPVAEDYNLDRCLRIMGLWGTLGPWWLQQTWEGAAKEELIFTEELFPLNSVAYDEEAEE